MRDDYLWDGQGLADPATLALEKTLRPLGYRERPFRFPEPRMRSFRLGGLLLLAGAAAATLLALSRPHSETHFAEHQSGAISLVSADAGPGDGQRD